MKQSINVSQFRNAFRDHGRADQFSYEALGAIYDYLEMLEEDCGTDTELDVIAICCDFTEYAGLAEFQADYDDSFESVDDIAQRTTVIPLSGEAFVVENF